MTSASLKAQAPARRMSREQRIQQLLDVAESLFVTRGFLDVALEDLAKAAGITRPVIYEHFGSKEGVYLACVRRARRAFETELATATAGLPLREGFECGTRIYFGVLAADPRRWELLFARSGLVTDGLSSELNDERAETIAQIATMYAEHLPTAAFDDVEAVAYLISGSAEQLGRWWTRHPDKTLDEITARHVSFVWPAIEALLG